MIEVEQWLPYVLADAPGCPEAVALREVKSAMIEFCKRSHIWLYSSDPIPAIANVPDYVLDIPPHADSALIKSVRFLGKELHLRTEEELDKASPGWRTKTGSPHFYVILQPTEILMDRSPSEAIINDAITASFALMPKKDAKEVEDFFFNDWCEEIADGAKYRLLRMPDRAWTNPQMAAHFYKSFWVGIARAKIKINTANGSRELTVKRPRIV